MPAQRWWSRPTGGASSAPTTACSSSGAPGGPAACAIIWRPAALSATFHGRDLFAPVAARLALGEPPPGNEAEPTRRPDWPDDLAEVVYVDHYGNAMTGLRAAALGAATELEVEGFRLRRGRTFGDVPAGAPLWYANANGLAEIGVNGGSAAGRFGLAPGSPVVVHRPG